MAISAGRLTQMISVLNPVLTRNAAGEMTEEWVSCGKIHADIPCVNISAEPEAYFRIAPEDWLRAEMQGEIVA
ncbi:TPA: head-tail adaptor protein, partial [Escherichia coli]|nr:head-tail adaptor protein [Escherichia coli]HAM3826327.1 head-tail adaptor protein [Escherichia coli]HAM4041002.1 head-tail adaptor protein [Escherichia coli]